MLNDNDKLKIVKLYREGYGTTEIAKILNTYPNKINRFLVKIGEPIRDRSTSQKLALEKGTAKHPTEGRVRSDEEKNKIKEGITKYWEVLDDNSYKERVEKAKEIWNLKTEEEKEHMRSLAAKGMALASREGSKLEKFLKKQLTLLNYNVVFHKKGLIENHNLEVDIFLPNQKVVIEIDGPTHFLPIWGHEKLAKVIKSDEEKNGLLISHGYAVLRFKYLAKRLGEKNKKQVIQAIKDYLNSDFQYGTITEIEV